MDFVQETFDLLDLIAANVGSTEGEEKLVVHFNDDGISSSIITHFRVNMVPPATLPSSFRRLTIVAIVAHHKCLDEDKRRPVRVVPD